MQHENENVRRPARATGGLASRTASGAPTGADLILEPFAGLSPDVILNAIDEILGGPDFTGG